MTERKRPTGGTVKLDEMLQVAAELRAGSAVHRAGSGSLTTVRLPGRSGTYGRLDVTVERALVDGRPQAIRLVIEGKAGISTADLRALPIGRLVSTDSDLETAPFLASERMRDRASPAVRDEAARRIKTLEAAKSSRPGRPSLGSSFYEEVAEVYSKAREAGKPPTGAVMRHFVVSKSAAAKYVHRCRYEYGLLGPTSRGRSAGTGKEPVTKRGRKP